MQKKVLLSVVVLTLILFKNSSFAQAPDLGVASTFALFTAAGAFNGDPATSVVGDIGTDVGAFTPPGFLVGAIHVSDPVSAQAAADVAIAYGYLAGLTCGQVLATPFGNNQTLLPNIYCIGSAAVLNANLTLDGGGNPGAIFIFQIDGELSTNPASNILLTNGANLCNVYWQVNGAFNHNGTLFQGTVIAAGAINFGFGANLSGRGLSTQGAISTSANTVTLPNACNCTLDITCPNPSGGTFQCVSNIPVGIPANVTVNSACGTPSVVITNTSTGSGCIASPYVLTRTYTVTDQGGHSATCVVTYTAIDQTPPTITCPATALVSCASNVPAAAPSSVTSTDLCGGGVSIVFVGDLTTTGTCANRFTITRTYRATDLCGNSATCAQTITVNDITAPTIVCPINVSVSCASNVPASSIAAVTSTDLCGGAVSIVFVGDVTTTGTCANRFSIARTYRATDLCGNSATCAQTITVNDITAPTVVCPINVSVSCASNVPASSIAAVSSTDLCGGAVSIVFVGDVITPGSCANRFSIARTYSATDLCGNSAACVQTITVNDQTPPSLTCPINVSVSCAADVPAAAPASIVASDLCGGAATVVLVGDVITNQICINRYTITRTYRATDLCGNSGICAQTITVNDIIAPVFDNPPANLTVDCYIVPPAGIPPTATDNCNGPVTVSLLSEVQTPGVCPIIYTLTRTWRAVDGCGNSATVAQVIAVQDTYAPQFTTNPADVVIECDLNTNGDAYEDWLDNFGGAIVFDCAVVTWSHIPSPFFTMPSMCGGTSQRFIRFIATDACGNSSFRDASFTIMDMTPPVFTVLPQNLNVPCEQGDNGEAQFIDWFEHFGFAEVSDKCGAVVTEIALLSDHPGCGNTFTRTYQFRATDECGNTNYVTATFSLVDNTPPVIVSCPQSNVLLTCEFDIPAPDTASVVAWDNCGAVKVSVQSIFTNGIGCYYWPLTKSYTYAVTDECGNVSTCYQSFQVVDSIPPVYSGPDTIFVLCVSDLPGVGDLGDVLAPYFVDNCYNIICVGEHVEGTDSNSVTYCVYFKDWCVNWADKFTVTFVATGGCKPLCSAPQNIWGNSGASINGMNTPEAIAQLINKYGPVKAGKLGKTISVSSAACLQNMLPGHGNTSQFAPGHFEFGASNECQLASPLLNSDGTLKNKLAANVLTLQLNVWYNQEFNERNLGVQLLASLPAVLVDPIVLSKLELDHLNVQGLLNLSNDYLAGVGFFPPNFGSPLNSTLENVSSYWQNCQLNDPSLVSLNVAGLLKTESNEGLEAGNIKLESSNTAGPIPSLLGQTDGTGYYEFSSAIPALGNYTVTPGSENMAFLNGVTTYDLVLISKHLLGWEPLNSPYKMIAADANHSGSITTFDIIELRKLILGVYDKLPDNTSWRFVDQAFAFPDPTNPFATGFPEYKAVEHIQTSQMANDFVSVKIGDVNGTAQANSMMSVEERTSGDLLFDLQDRLVKSGETFEVNLTADQAVQSYQFTLNTEGLEVLDVTGEGMNTGNFAVFAANTLQNGQTAALTTSWNLPEGTVAGVPHITLRFHATQSGRLSEMLHLSSTITKVEARKPIDITTINTTDLMALGIALRFYQEGNATISGLGFELYQNVPNPFVDNTSIGFYLPAATQATLTVYDQTGRLVYTQQGDFAKGYNAFVMERQLIKTNGVLLYKLETATDRATKIMIQAK